MLFKQAFRRCFLAAILSFTFSFAFAQSSGTIGLGIKAGDPTGLSVKFYRPSAAIELVVGRPYYFNRYYYDRGYYETRFRKFDKYKDGHFHYDFYDYNASTPFAVQVHFLKSKSTKTAKELKWYFGGGPQLRAYKVEYFYRYREYYGPDKNDYVIRTASDRYTDLDLGLDGVFGLEYTFSDLPLSIFGDINLFLELVDEINLYPQGGLGIRYNLK